MPKIIYLPVWKDLETLELIELELEDWEWDIARSWPCTKLLGIGKGARDAKKNPT